MAEQQIVDASLPPSSARVAQLADQRVAADPTPGTWGVYDLHTREWVSHGWFYERDAWEARIQTASLHPWELRTARADIAGRPVFPEDDYDDDCGPGCPECGAVW